jgi:hypothetical protein
MVAKTRLVDGSTRAFDSRGRSHCSPVIKGFLVYRDKPVESRVASLDRKRLPSGSASGSVSPGKGVPLVVSETEEGEMKTIRRGRAKTPELATVYFKPLTPGEWAIRGAGAMYGGAYGIPMHPRLDAILDALKRDGIAVSRTSSGSPGNCDSYTFSAEFDDGGLSVRTGNYWFDSRGGSISGTEALNRLIRLLNLRVTPQTARAWAIQRTVSGRRPSQPHPHRTRSTPRQSK